MIKTYGFISVKLLHENTVHQMSENAPRTLCGENLNQPHTTDLEEGGSAFFYCPTCPKIVEAMEAETVPLENEK